MPHQTSRPMEQFTREHQDTLNQYLNDEIGEQVPQYVQAAAWPNYESGLPRVS